MHENTITFVKLILPASSSPLVRDPSRGWGMLTDFNCLDITKLWFAKKRLIFGPSQRRLCEPILYLILTKNNCLHMFLWIYLCLTQESTRCSRPSMLGPILALPVLLFTFTWLRRKQCNRRYRHIYSLILASIPARLRLTDHGRARPPRQYPMSAFCLWSL